MTLKDQSGSIKATAFKEDADHLYKELQVGKTYIITRGSIKPTNKRYDSSGHEYEITFDRDTTVEITSCKDGRLLKKRDVTVLDDSNASVGITLWGGTAESFEGEAPGALQ